MAEQSTLEKIACVLAYGSIAAGVIIGGAISYVQDNPLPAIYGAGSGSILSFMPIIAGINNYHKRVNRRE